MRGAALITGESADVTAGYLPLKYVSNLGIKLGSNVEMPMQPPRNYTVHGRISTAHGWSWRSSVSVIQVWEGLLRTCLCDTGVGRLAAQVPGGTSFLRYQ